MSKRDFRKDAQSVGDALRDFLNSNHLSSKFDEANLLNSWERIAGKPIASRTKKLFIRNKVLFVELESPSMKHDFSIHKTQVLDLFKKEFGSGIITDIIVM
jgi:predicted nucleic acid-binding Zn ribbon protein